MEKISYRGAQKLLNLNGGTYHYKLIDTVYIQLDSVEDFIWIAQNGKHYAEVYGKTSLPANAIWTPRGLKKVIIK